MTCHSAIRTTVIMAALAAAAGAFAQGSAAPPSESGARKGYPTAAAHEAAAARAANLKPADGGAPVHMRNALERCNGLPAGYKEACYDRVHGAGTATGSVQGGGILRESEVPADRLQSGATYVSPHHPVIEEEPRVQPRHPGKKRVYRK